MRKLLLTTTSLLVLNFCLLSVTAQALEPEPEDTSAAIAYANQLSGAFEAVAKKITPSVVSISATVNIKPTLGGKNSPLPSDPFFEHFKEFFGEEMIPDPQGKGQSGKRPLGIGTGVVIDEAGHILTNNHVIGEADEVAVKLNDGRKFDAKVVGKDPRTDLAVIKIEAKNLVPASLGKSSELKIGEWVVAAGSPFGLDYSVTAGIVSAKGRSIMGGSQYEDFIQTDAAINPGNSGGPLVNLKGEVIGINTAIFSRSGGYMGIGFAIPSDMAKRIMHSLIKDGQVTRGWLGVGIQNLTEDLAKSFNYKGTEGALVGHVDPTGPAAKAGIKQGDIITKMDNQDILDINQLRNNVANYKPETTVNLVIHRDGNIITLPVVIGTLKSDEVVEEVKKESSAQTEEKLGITLEPLNEEIARKLGTDQTKGLAVTQVFPYGIGARSGLMKKDVILQVNGNPVASIADFEKFATKDALAQGVRLLVETRNMERFVLLKVEE
ncbi:MAG: DegQ family serine endoprotease [Bdellovibrionota bacterium]